jgi:hypothetical protein
VQHVEQHARFVDTRDVESFAFILVF